MQLDGVSVAVIGLGASGDAAARLAFSKGAEVYVSDSREDASVAARGADLRAAGVTVDLGRHDVDRVAGAELVVVSPGIGPDAPVLRELARRGVGWVTEPELAARFLPGPLIAVTGTNGKTTVTLLIDHLLDVSGVPSAAGGNVGGGLAPPASDLAIEGQAGRWSVIEMSSFQLAGIDTFRPDIGVVTNLSPDHLDRYGTVAAYYADKARLFDNAHERSVWVLPEGEEEVAALAGDAAGTRYTFGQTAGRHARLEGSALTLAVGGTETLCEVDELPLIGRHNVDNALAAALTARLAGATAEGIATGLRSATPLPHRLQPVRERNGVLWVNDSKATNVAAAVGALESLDRPIVLLAGGKDKGEDFGALAAALPGRVHTVLLFGEAADRLERELSAVRTHPSGEAAPELEVLGADLGRVVARADRVARPGDVVLLAPACSSFDMFHSYEERGTEFVGLVGRLT